VQLTPAGEVFLGHARRALQAVQAGRSFVTDVRTLRRGLLRLGATDAAVTGILASALLRFHQSYPQVEVSVEIESTSVLVQGLRQGRVDLVLGTLPVEAEDLEVLELSRERLGLVAAPGAALGDLPALLSREPFIAYPRNSTTRRLVDDALVRGGLAFRPVMEIGRPSVMVRLVAAGLGVSVLPEDVSAPQVTEGALAAVPFSRFSVRRTLGLLTLRGQDLDPAARALKEILEAVPR
jgi:DNA-binding transcriptional LysR family regulator